MTSPGKVVPSELREVLESLAAALVTSSKDLSLDHRDAWIYGILLGWGDSFESVAEKHRWDSKTRARLKRQRGIIERVLSGDDETAALAKALAKALVWCPTCRVLDRVGFHVGEPCNVSAPMWRLTGTTKPKGDLP